MAVAKDIHATVFRNATATFLARVENTAGEALTQTSVVSIRYSVFELDLEDPDATSVVVGHDNVALTVADVVFDTLQLDQAWTVDAVGYNFRYELDVSAGEAFAQAGRVYQVRFEISPVLGQKIVFRFQLRCL